jgi:hypothetical protein
MKPREGCSRADRGDGLRGDLLFSLEAWLGDHARKGAVKKRTQLKGKVSSKPAGTKRDKTAGEFTAVI